MKKILTGIILAGLMTPAFAVAAPQAVKKVTPYSGKDAIELPIQTLRTMQGFVSVNATSEGDYAPNTAIITLYVETIDKSLNKATEDNKREAANAIAAVNKILDTKNGDTLKTVSFSVNPEYSYQKDNKRVLDGYRVVNSFEVKTKNPKEIGRIIDTALNSGVTRVDGLRYSLDTSEEICNNLISAASRIARTRAENTAEALGVKVSGLKQISTSCSGGEGFYPYARTFSANKAMDSAGGGDIPTEAGLIKFRANADAQFWVK